jgi:uncharacterized protein YjbI with pentapeptide repeats
MANEEHLAILKQGVEAWNQWRKENFDIKPNLIRADLIRANLRRADLRRADLNGACLRGAYLIRVGLSRADLSKADLSKADLSGATLDVATLSGADLRAADPSGALLSGAHLSGADLSGARLIGTDLIGAHLSGADLIGAHLSGADLSGADLRGADLGEAHLSGAHLSGANLSGTDLRGADLRAAHLSGAYLRAAHLSGAHLSGTDLSGADLSGADLREADLEGADLSGAILLTTSLERANLTNCSIYGISVWGVTLEGAAQSNLIITPPGEPTITVDNLEVAQFIYLLLNNQRIRQVIETITSKVVLILGRFIPERKVVLDALRVELRKRDYLPVVFDFDPSVSRDLTETVSTLAHMSRFIIADISEPRSIPQELQAIVPNLPSVAVRPIIVHGEHEYGMFEHFKRYPWVLPVYEYEDTPQLLASLTDQVIVPAEAKVKELRPSPEGRAESAEAGE